ncbi:hypothetical protein MXB_4200, partial [Myxobolus squamalis]
MDILFDKKYLEFEPHFVVDFFLTYSIFFTESTELIYKIQNCLINDVIRQKAAAILITWITYCPEDFSDDYMRDFIIFIIRELKLKSCDFLAEVISHVCFTRSLAYEIRFISSSGIHLFDQIIIFNDFQVSEMTISQVNIDDIYFIVGNSYIHFNHILSDCKTLYYQFIFIVFMIEYTCIANSLIDLFQAVLGYNLFKTLTLTKKTARKAVTSSIDFRTDDFGPTNESRNSLNQANISYNTLSKTHSNPPSTEESWLPKHQDTHSNAHFFVKVCNSANEAKYLNVARCDSCKKIANDLFFHASL